MAFTVMNNPSAVMSLGELNKNINNQSKSQKKLATGMKINSAGDDASAYTISERMRSHLRALNQDIDNVKNGRAMLSVAAGGIDNIVQELRNLKELAIKSANDSNTDKDRATIQKEFEQKMANINDIATETNYNGKLLLDGRYGGIFGFSSDVVTTGSWVSSQTEPTGTPIMIPSGNYTISADGVYMLTSGYQGTVTIANGVKNVEIQQQTPFIALNEAFIVGPSSGEANLWIEGLNISNTIDKSVIDFQGSNNYLTLKGNNVLTTYPVSNASTLVLPHHDTAVVHIGGGLTIESNGNSSLNIQGISNARGTVFPHFYYGAGIGTNDGEFSNANIVITGGQINVKMENSLGAAIGGGTNGDAGGKIQTIGNVAITGGIVNATVATSSFFGGAQAGLGAGIGGGDGQVGKDIIIQNAMVTAFSEDGAAIGSGLAGDWNDIVIDNSIINARSYVGAGIGAGRLGTVNNITITDSNVTAVCDNNDVILGPITSFQGENIGKGTSNSRVLGNITITGTYSGHDISTSIENTSTTVSNANLFGNPLIIHHGTRANQALNCYINDMHTDAMGLSGTKVVTREDAQWALSDDSTDPPRIGAIDQAINYALNEATTVGAYISRLETTEDNLVISSENAQSSESTIRDADMAKEMAEFTKNNVLAQASQSMLAQANQNSSSVLSLLQ